MDQASAGYLPDLAQGHVASRLTIGFILDIATIGRQDAQLLDALLVAAIIDANVNRLLREPGMQAAYATLDSPPPDELRRPVSINALAESLRLPFETVRRHVRQLVAQGICAASAQGVHVPTHVLTSPQFCATQQLRYDRLLQLHRELVAAKILEPPPFVLPPADDPRAPVRAVGRILSDYFFRTVALVQDFVPDPMRGLMLLEMVRLSSEHIPPAEFARLLQAGTIPDHARALVRVAELSRRLRVPYETTRRHVGALVDAGFCRRVERGVLVSGARIEAAGAAHREGMSHLKRMFRLIAALGPVSDEAPPGPAGD